MLRGGKRKEGHTDVVSSICTVFIDKFRIYIVPIGRSVVYKLVFTLPSGKVMQALVNNYIGTIILFVRGLVYVVDTAIKV